MIPPNRSPSAATLRAREQLEEILSAALAAVDARTCVREFVHCDGERLEVGGSIVPTPVGVVAVGKAAAAMAQAFEIAAGDAIAWGIAITKDGHGLSLSHHEVRESGHPIPDARSERAAREVAARIRDPDSAKTLIVLLSGGASALWACPRGDVTAADLARTTRALLASGADIEDMNTVRKHLTELSGGRMAREARASRIVVLAMSDVIGDRLDVIASGPCTPDPTTFADALRVLARYGLRERVPSAVRAHLEAGARGECEETPKPGDPLFGRVAQFVVASNRRALAAAARAAAAAGSLPLIVSEALAGEAREVGRRFAALSRSIRSERPVCLLAGGETTVQIRGRGRGGRNQELALAAALALEGADGVDLLAAASDGSDGPTDAAGAFADGRTTARGRALGIDAQASLDDNDSYRYFAAEGGLLRTGPTRTNVMDLTIALVNPHGP